MIAQNRSAIPNAVAVRIRNAQFKDLDALTALLQVLHGIAADFEPDPARQRRGLSLMLDGCGKHRSVMVAEIKDRVVGMCTVQTIISTAEGGIVALVEDMMVDPAYQGLGIGRRLMDEIEAWALRHHAFRLQLLADCTNASASNFYAKIGWRLRHNLPV